MKAPANTDHLSRAVGEAITAWQMVEYGLFRVFHRALGGPALGPLSAAFTSVDAAHAKSRMVDAAVRVAVKDRALIEQWSKLYVRTGKMRDKRNTVAHRAVGMVQIGDGPTQAALMPYLHDMRHLFAEDPGLALSRVDLQGVETYQKKFLELGADLLRFADNIAPPASPP